ncbi:unnamed protein product [Heterobilharzia americana]|nr:unnamed protein product [Heterobilharzia americana]
MIALFKNHLHGVIITSKDASEAQNKIADPENSIEACYTEISHIFHLIFLYPLPHCLQEDITDESCWLLAALNLALYIFIRFKAYPESSAHTLFNILVHTSDAENSYFRKFMRNLKSRLEQRITQCQTLTFTLETTLSNPCSASERNRLKSELTVQESIMLRLHLLQVTLHQTDTAFQECDPIGNVNSN